MQAEAQLPFAGPHQLLRPILPSAEQLPPPQRGALLAGLDAAAAGALLDAHARACDGAPRAAAGGGVRNPLALVELPAALGADQLGNQAPLPARLPLTARLEQAFGARVAELPATTRRLLLIAAADDGGSWPGSFGRLRWWSARR